MIVSKFWTQNDAIELCRKIENLCPRFGCHVALTGGVLYKEGLRKDLDILFYRIRQSPEIDKTGLLEALETELGFAVMQKHGWVQKAVLGVRHIDLFFPDHVDVVGENGEYQ